MILILVGTGVNCQFALSADPNVSPSPKGSYLGFNIAWGCGTRVLQSIFKYTVNAPKAAALGVWVSVGVSGGHINPAVCLRANHWTEILNRYACSVLQVTLGMAVFRRLSWFKAFTYILGQIIGAWLGALVVFANYSRGIDIFEGGTGQKTLKTASLFSTYPVRIVLFYYLSLLTKYPGTARLRIVSQLLFRRSKSLRLTRSARPCPLILIWKFIGTFILVFVVFAISDKHNSAIHPSLIPLVIFMLILGIGAAFGMQTGTYNRDQSPRFTVTTGPGLMVVFRRLCS